MTEADRREEIVRRVTKNDENAVPEFRELLKQVPTLIDIVGSLAEIAERTLVKAITGEQLLFSETLTAKLDAMRAELAGPQPNPIERLLVERLVACWLQVYHADAQAAKFTEGTFAEGNYMQRRQNRAHRRFLSAIKTLATVRRLALPTLVAVNVNATVARSGD